MEYTRKIQAEFFVEAPRLDYTQLVVRVVRGFFDHVKTQGAERLQGVGTQYAAHSKDSLGIPGNTTQIDIMIGPLLTVRGAMFTDAMLLYVVMVCSGQQPPGFESLA